jgi:hypothetical protein
MANSIGSYKSNNHTITATTAPNDKEKNPRYSNLTYCSLMTFGHVNNIKASKYLNRFYPIELEHNDTNYRFSLNAPTKLNYGTIKLYHLILNILNFQFLLKVYNWIIRIVCVLADILFLVLNATFSNISSFSGGRSRSTRREPPTMGKQLVNFITCGCESSATFFVIYKTGHELTLYWW